MSEFESVLSDGEREAIIDESHLLYAEHKASLTESAIRLTEQAVLAKLAEQDREDALIEVMLDACDEWSQYVEVDTAPRTLREYIQLAIDHASRDEEAKE